MKPLEIVFFDMGNTILDFHQGISDEEKVKIGLDELRKYINSEYYYHYTTEDIYERFQKPLDDFLDNERKQKGIECNIVDYFANVLNEEFLDQQTVDKLCKIYYSEFAKYLVVNDGMEELLKILKEKELSLWIVSNAFLPDSLYIDLFKELGIYKYFHGFTFSYSHTYLKPNTSIFKAALQKATKRPEQAIFIGDNYEVDILPAKELGMEVFHYRQGDKIERILSKIESLKERF